MKVILLTVLFLGIGMVGFLVRLLFIKNAEVRGGCASKNPLLSAEMGKCPTCGALPTEECASEMPKIRP